MGSSRDDIRIFERRRNDVGSNQTRDVSHIGQQVSTDFITDISHSLVIIESRICTHTSNNQLGSEIRSMFFQLIIINQSSSLVGELFLNY